MNLLRDRRPVGKTAALASGAPAGGARWACLLRAHLVLIWAWWAVRTRPARALAAAAASKSTSAVPAAGNAADEDMLVARRIAGVLNRVARATPLKTSRLMRAIALTKLLRWYGLTGARVQVGVITREAALHFTGDGVRDAQRPGRSSNGDLFIAHAWVRFRGVDLDETRAAMAKVVPGPRLKVSA